jgi:hypothetical protein
MFGSGNIGDEQHDGKVLNRSGATDVKESSGSVDN